ncbi:MAG: tetratricopeptide repeat protein, partial [Campylobacter sp.]|nr:tetratricopeptide repeat protein [Campylobacter sp.]
MLSAFTKAAKLYKEEKYNQALGEISKLDKKYKSEENILIFTGNCYDSLGKKEIAKSFYRKAYKKNKQSQAALLNLAIIYFEQKKYMLSKFYIKKLLHINSKNYNSITLLGNIYKEKKQYEKAIKLYQKAIGIEKNFYTANINLADIYYQQKKYSQAYAHAKKALISEPQKAEGIKLFAEISIENFQPDDAILYLEKLAKKTNADYWIYNLLSQLYMQQKKYETSIKAAQKAVEISQGENSQHINFGYILYDSILADQNELVQKYADIWLKKYPKNSIVQHMANSVLHNQKVSQNDITYVREIFNAFANDFEDIL